MKYLVYVFALSVTLLSCKASKITDYSGVNYPITDTTFKSNDLDSLIFPYKKGMEEQMSKVIGHTNYDLEAYLPESPLSNFVADVVFDYGFKFKANQKAFNLTKTNTFCLLNIGGLRSTINKGPITVGNIYELMPFDNEIVILKLEPFNIREMLFYLFEKNGQPISNAIAYINSNEGRIDIGGQPYNFKNEVYVITSDYLASGGDKMTFFKEKPLVKTGILIRNALIDFVSKVKELPPYKVEGRIQQIR
jgi:2',3'-cyclic-nucleotide 2'-phosphodiesterase (5'-nucleotidase family)